MDWRLVLDRVEQLFALRRVVFADAGDGFATAIHGPVLRLHHVGQRLPQHRQRRARVAGDDQVRLDLTEREARGERIGGNVDHLGVLARRMRPRNPGHDRVKHDDHVGLWQQAAGLEADMHGVLGREVEVARLALHHRQRERLGQHGQLFHRFG